MRSYNASLFKDDEKHRRKINGTTLQTGCKGAVGIVRTAQTRNFGRGRRRKADMDIVPSYLLREQEGKKLKSSSLGDYLKKANVIEKKFKNKILSPQVMEELEK